jgi:hypothetical protein
MHNELWHLITEFIEKEILYLFLKKSRFFHASENMPGVPGHCPHRKQKTGSPFKSDPVFIKTYL